jgi:hypothetical protein
MAVQELLSIVNGRPEDIPSFAVVPCLAFRRLPNARVGLHDALKDRHAVAMLAGQRPLPPTSSCDREYSCSLLGPIPAAGSRGRTIGPGALDEGLLSSDDVSAIVSWLHWTLDT